MSVMDERVLTSEGREALSAELREEAARGPQPQQPYDPAEEPIGTLLRLLPGGRLELTENTPRGTCPDRERPDVVMVVTPHDEPTDDVTDFWQAWAVCAENPRATNGETPQDRSTALAMCARCPVRPQCRTWADGEPEFMGVAGGLYYGDQRAKTGRARKAVA